MENEEWSMHMGCSRKWESFPLLVGTLFQIRAAAGFVEVVALAVDHDDDREVFDFQPANGFRAEVGIGDDLGLLHAFAQQRAKAADRAQIDRAVPAHGVDHGFAALTLADHAGLAEGDQRGGVRVHAVGGGGAGGADDLTRLRGRGADEIDDCALDIEGQRLALRRQLAQPLVGGVAGGVDLAGQHKN